MSYFTLINSSPDKLSFFSDPQEKEEAKIIYIPDNADDFDEEDDPDNDLQF
jgi:hypothetical protein